jgi:FKBP-type peptidyl-prolyl cis-trans isomerase
MRRRAVAISVAVGVLLVAACSDDDDSDAGPTTSSGATTVPGSTVVDGTLVPTSPPASVPDVATPAEAPTELVVTEITPGDGSRATNGDLLIVNYVGVRSEDGAQFDSNYGGAPFPVTLGAGGVIAGWDQGLQGARVGERLQLDVPADLAYGDQPPGEPIQPGDALSFVIDVLSVVPKADLADPPDETDVPVSDEPATKLVVDDLAAGDGAALAEGDTAVVHLVAARADTGEVLESTWTSGRPQTVVVASGQLLPALVEGLPGMKVGGRRAVTIPFADFEANGLADLGLPADTDLVVVTDLLFAV